MKPADYPYSAREKSKSRSGTVFYRAALREFANIAGGVFVALFAILLTTQLIRLLGQAAGGKLASEAVVALLGFGALNYLPILLSLTLFVSILLALSRSYRDSEMLVWFSSGQSLTAWVRPVLAFAAPLVLAVGVLSLFLSPWAVQQSAEYRQRLTSREDVSQVTPGAFRETSGADRVFFVEAVSGEEAIVRNIFVSSMQQGKLGIMVASQGFQEIQPDGSKFLVLLKGRRYEGTPGTPEYQMMEFERYSVRIESREAGRVKDSPKAMSVVDLIANPTNQAKGELLWRIGIPLAALNLALLAIPLSFVNPRAGRANNMLMAIFAYMLYSNLIGVCQAWVVQGKLRFEIGVWAVHLFMFVLLVALFYRRISLHSWLRLRR